MYVLQSSLNEEYTLIYYNPITNILEVNRQLSSLSPDVNKDSISVQLTPESNIDYLQLQVFIDHSIIEIYANQMVRLTR